MHGAGRLIGRNAMVWTRRLPVPVEQVWATVASLEGLRTWWFKQPAAEPPKVTEFELRQGGMFRHHWDNTILDFKQNQFIHFDGMRFELRERDGSTEFVFLDTWEATAVPPTPGLGSEQPGGPGTPWAGVAAGWHGTVDALEAALTGEPREDLFEIRCGYYARYLSDYFRWIEIVQQGFGAARRS